MIRLVNVYDGKGRMSILPGASRFLYELMAEREPEMNISHRGIPTFEDHVGFIRRHPFRAWYLIEVDGNWVGYVSATHHNEIGVVIRKAYRGKGYGPEAIKALMKLYRPNAPEPSACNGMWLANISPLNAHSKHVFQKLGFRKLQETYCLEEETYGKETPQTAAST